MRLPFNKIIRKVTRYRLGYNVQRDYPGRWTTPIVTVVYIALAVVLALMNIPLTAYDTVQEYTYTPNATIPPLPFLYVIPSFLRSRLPHFSPQTLRVGDVLYLNNSTEAYSIIQADKYNFLFYNNPLTSCDVQYVTIKMESHESVHTFADISCWFPVWFILQWEKFYYYDSDHPTFALDLRNMMSLSARCSNASIVTSHGGFSASSNYSSTMENDVTWTLGGEPYCPGSSPQSTPNVTNHLPCSAAPINFAASLQSVNIAEADGTQRWIDAFDVNPEASDSIHFQDPICTSTYELAKENVFQGVYHYLRRDLGIRSRNQIWASPVVFNKTIHALPPDVVPSSVYANDLRANRTGSTWVPWDMDHDTTIRTPKIYYSRWTYRRKSLGSAITSVFVATFTMLAAIWRIFTFIAGLVISKADDLAEPPSEWESEARELREEIASMAEVRASVQELQRMMRSPAPRYRLSLPDTGDSTFMESLLSSVDDDDSKEENRNGYDRV